MNCKLRNTARLTCLVVMAALLSPSASTAAEKTLPNTQPLTITQPLDEFMIDGLDRFCLRELAASPARREKMWKRDFSSTEAYEKSIAPNRERFREYIGAVDKRVTESAPENFSFELLATFNQSAVLARSNDVTVHRVRWQVLEGVTAEGLLLEPEGVNAAVVALPDADWTPEAFCGIGGDVPKSAQLPWRLASEGCLVVVPMLISRSSEFSGSPHVAYTNQTHREFIYRQAFEMGRHVIGYEVQKTLAAIDLLGQWMKSREIKIPVGVAGVGEGGLVALYSSAIDSRVDATMVSGYFGTREAVWEEPIYRNVWGLLTEFGDAELAGLIAPRPLVIEACGITESAGPPAAAAGRRGGAAPGKVQTVTLGSVRAEYDRANSIYDQLKAGKNCQLHSSGEGDGSAGTQAALQAFAAELGIKSEFKNKEHSLTIVPGTKLGAEFTDDRQRRQIDELQRHVQDLMRLSPKVRDKVWAKGDRSSVEKWEATSASLRDWTYDELIGRLPEMNLPMNAKSRLVLDEPEYLGYEITLDCYRDVVAGGILLLPKDLKPGEKRPVVVCQHGLEGTPMDAITEDRSVRSWNYYKGFASELCKRGFITYAPQNPYRGKDRFRTIQRKSNPLKRSLFSYIIPQHQRTLDWLATLPNVDSDRIAFYGLSYGGKTAVRVPPMLTQGKERVGYCLSICSADFNEWVKKNVSNEDRYSYLFTGEYEIFEWNMGHVANYAELSSLMAPRPFMVERGHDDGVAPDEWVAWEFAKVRRHYVKLGIGEKTEIEFFNGPHSINGQATYRFLHRHLDWPEPSTN
ncbi:MAG: cephalosporin-C deacetylase-like acetyl esterase [Planctomycetaceae bacterium]|jgi:cephalosporin-C deacetylase-like acetyl esterase